MSTDTTESPWTDVGLDTTDVRRLADKISRMSADAGLVDALLLIASICDDLDALAPRVAELQRAAAVEALREFADLVDSRYPTDVWPPIANGEHVATPDRHGADMARAVARQARHEADQIERGER